MTEHLPECPVKSVVCEGEFCHCDYAHFCNCNELRAREERIGGLITRQRAEQIGRNIGQHGCVITEQRHLPECPMLEPCSAVTQHCYCSRQNTCIHDEMECICDALRACEARVVGDALSQARAREVNGVTWAQAWSIATDAHIAAFHDRISDSDLDDLLSDDEKDIVAQAIRSARQRP